MELLALKLFVAEGDVNRLLAEHLPGDVGVENLRVRLTPEGVQVLGDYPTVFLKVAFETLWAVGVAGGRLEARLASVKVAGVPATLLRGVLMKALEDAARRPGVAVEGESVLLDADAFLRAKGIPLSLNLKEVLCSLGSLVVRAGTDN
jgi:hypothetical protein